MGYASIIIEQLISYISVLQFYVSIWGASSDVQGSFPATFSFTTILLGRLGWERMIGPGSPNEL